MILPIQGATVVH